MAIEESNCAYDVALHKGKIEKEHMFQFLARLNKCLDDVRSRIPSRVPLPSIREVFSEVRHEASKSKIMLQEGSSIMVPMDSIALASKISTTNGKEQAQKSNSTASVAHYGTWAPFTTPHNYKWIIGLGALDHMTSNFKLFRTYIPCVGHEKINTASGSSSAIAGKGSILISKNLQLDYVQHVLT
ncbi:hypothetical protein L6164_001219 [Bauhinia variegata]|uniref:Uncharacterized protein n=1 Tax=Bauhinia variegata TaxID=167791 RepID=A0ACB9Q986_BAUVA|nr:hypothetical protein L6164_001219 [Bauhinia variegata]